MRILILVVTVLLCSCTQVEQPEERLYPSDYLFAQRSFPHGKVDLQAYRQAVSDRQDFQNFLKGPFDLEWHSAGPTNINGRISDLELSPDEDNVLYVGTASGGIFKSEDLGSSYTSIFDDAESLSIGDMAISKNNPDLIYVGTGESNAGGGSIAYDGLGMYYSDDAGASWERMGLEKAGSIGKVVIDPNDDNKVLVAAMGALFANSSDRGIYRTKDQGQVWEQVLFLSDSTGGIDLAIHPQNGEIVYAAMWERIRRPYNRQYGGATTGIYKTTDGGDNWSELTVGLPSLPEDKGRIGLAISESNPNILYAYYANATGILNGIYRSEDGGDSWTLVNSDVVTTTFNWWFGKIFVHPTDPDDVYLTNINMFRSRDGGASWYQVFEEAHVDHHAMAIHPSKTEIVFNGNDGGVYLGLGEDYIESDYKNGLNNFQFYTCEIDPSEPSRLYGGAQDNGTVRTFGNVDAWSPIGGGDGFRVIVSPDDSDVVYFEFQYGNIRKTEDGGATVEWGSNGLDGRFNWNTPIVMDPNNSRVLYTGSQQLYRTINGADSWQAISPVLVNESNPQGNLTFGSITAIDVSSHDSQVIYIGTDDGNLWVTKDGGATYNSIKGAIPDRWITAVTHDPHRPAGVYVTVSGFRFGEAEGQVYYSSDFGENWASIGAGLPDVPCNDIVADGIIDELIYVATDIGVFTSVSRGDHWSLLGTNLPVVPVTDLDIHDETRLLAAATFGKGMYTYDLPLSVANEELVSESKILLYPNPVIEYLTVETEINVLGVEIYNLAGILLKKEAKSKRIYCGDLVSGTYTAVIRTESGVEVKKFIKN